MKNNANHFNISLKAAYRKKLYDLANYYGIPATKLAAKIVKDYLDDHWDPIFDGVDIEKWTKSFEETVEIAKTDWIED